MRVRVIFNDLGFLQCAFKIANGKSFGYYFAKRVTRPFDFALCRFSPGERLLVIFVHWL